jgi:hypothetical protein
MKPETAATNLLRNTGLTAAQEAAIRWDPDKWRWLVEQAKDGLDALDDPNWPDFSLAFTGPVGPVTGAWVTGFDREC